MKRVIPLLCVTLCMVTTAAERAEKPRSWSDVDHWAKVFDDPARDAWQRPLALLGFLGVEPGETVADIGAGTGYFTKLLSVQVGPEGRVYAVDTERAMLKYLMSREDVIVDRVVPVRAKKNDPKLPDGEIDLVVMINTWHHIDERASYLERLANALTPEGRVAIVDFREGELPVGPPPGHKLSRETVVAEFEQANWRLVAASVALPYQYALIFLPPAKPDTRQFLGH